MIRTLIIDDEPRSRATLSGFIAKYCPGIEVAGEAGSVATGLAAILQHRPDVVFLDIQMPDGTGFDLLEKLPRIDFRIIFVTAYDQYALKAFKYNAIDYLLKPVNPQQLAETVRKLTEEEGFASINKKLEALMFLRNSFEKIPLPSQNDIRFVCLKDIVRFEGESNYTMVTLISGEKILVTRHIGEYEKALPPAYFYRIHQSHLVNLSYIQQYIKGEGGYVVLDDGTRLEVARRRKAGFLEVILNFKMQSGL